MGRRRRGEEGEMCALGASGSTAGGIALLCLALGSVSLAKLSPTAPAHHPLLCWCSELCSLPSRHKSSSQKPCWYQHKALLTVLSTAQRN